jgi:DNA repair protein RadC
MKKVLKIFLKKYPILSRSLSLKERVFRTRIFLSRAVMKVKLTKEQKIKVLNSVDVFDVMHRILRRENKIGRSKEHFWVVCLSNSNRILLIELISLGTMTKTLVDPTEVFSFALQKRAVQLIMVHNHPSGELKPSWQDKDITDKMYQVGQFLELPVLDHLIISETGFYSFMDSGLLAKISRSRKYVLKYKKEELRIERRGEKKGLKKGVKIGKMQKAIQMAKSMKREGFDIKVIAKISGLSARQIEKL